jgi:glycosyltransferase involved in cell wall biosynthesis
MKHKPRIAVIGLKGLPAFGGAAAVGENIINQLKDEYEFTVYSTSSHTTQKTGLYNGYEQIVFRKLPFKRINTLYYYLVSMFHALFFGTYDIIHLHHSDAAFIVPILRLKYPVILTTHGAFNITTKWQRYNFYFKIQVRYFVKFANIVTCVSKQEERNFKNLNIQAIYIPNGISKVNIIHSNSNYLLFAAGRLIASKGCHIFLEALNHINYKGKIIIAGDYNQSGFYYDNLKKLSANLDCDFVGLLKEKEKLFKLIAGATLFVYPSVMEAMSMMLLETASIGTPIICSDIVGNRDLFKEDEVLFFRNQDTLDLSKKILYALSNPAELLLKARKLKDRLLQEQSWQVIANQYKVLYEKLLMNK